MSEETIPTEVPEDDAKTIPQNFPYLIQWQIHAVFDTLYRWLWSPVSTLTVLKI